MRARRPSFLSACLSLTTFLSLSLGLADTTPASALIPTVEHDALVALYLATNGDGWSNRDGWLGPSGTECTWRGVACDFMESSVVGLALTSNQLSGVLPPELGDLSHLQSLGLAFNQVSGPIPPELGRLDNLVSLDLEVNQLSGPIPPELGGLSHLLNMGLGFNQLSGGIPPELGSLGNLGSLQLGFNQLSGPIPPALGGLSNLQVLDLGGNRLSGSIPLELGSLGKLSDLFLSGNQLIGAIPPELGALSNLQQLFLSSNSLTGTIPPELGNLGELRILEVAFNQMTGPIPAELEHLEHLMRLTLSWNQLTGPIPPELGSLSNLQLLVLERNHLTGAIPQELGNLGNLLNLSLGNNQLTGPIPPELGDLDTLQVLSLSGNQLSGTIPPELGNLTNVQLLWLSGNRLSGRVPDSFLDLAHLQLSALGWNALFTDNDDLRLFLEPRDVTSWETNQTLAPSDVAAVATGPDSIRVTWSPIRYTADAGGYRVSFSASSGGPYDLFARTGSKSDASMDVTGLDPATTYFFIIQTVTEPHGSNSNTVESELSEEVSATTESADRPPVADAGQDQVAECAGPRGAEVVLDGSGSTDPDGDLVSWEWFEDGQLLASGPVVAVTLALGFHEIDLVVTDSGGLSDSDRVVVQVLDTTPPSVESIEPVPGLLWPPNHKLRPVTVAVSPVDACDPDPSCRITAVTSNEPVNGLGDGETAPDWVVTGALTADLRAERSGSGTARVYDLTVVCQDAGGLASEAIATVAVPHDRSR